MILWRISNYATLDGLGGLRYGARWHSKGRPVVNTSDHPAAALLEMLVHIDTPLLPDHFQLLKITVSDHVAIEEAAEAEHWLSDAEASRAIGDLWLQGNTSLLLRVPSVILPDVYNTLINPAHPDADRAKIISVQKVPLDARLR